MAIGLHWGLWHISPMSEVKKRDVFFAYPSHPNLRAEAIRSANAILKQNGVDSLTWEDLSVNGNLIISEICKAILSSKLVIAEISDFNGNVLFEAGYALAQNRDLWLALDDTDEDAKKTWKEVGIFTSIGIVNYSGNAIRLATKYNEGHGAHDNPVLFQSLVAGARSREENAIFAPSVPTKFTAVEALEKFLERQSHLKILASGDDLGVAPLNFYVKEIYRSSAAIFHLIKQNRTGAKAHNARASFLAGFAYGLELPVLMVVEDGFESPLDYRDLLFKYSSSAVLQTYVNSWLQSFPKLNGTNKRLGRLVLDIELPIRSFGEYVAEYELNELTRYFLNTSEFHSILEGSAKIFIGRKGTGKTATMTQAVIELEKDRRNLVVPIKPSTYDLASLIEIIRKHNSDSSSEYTLLSLWTYLIYTEIAIAAIINANSLPAKIGDHTAYQELEIELSNLGINLTDDLSTRLEVAVNAIENGELRSGESQKDFVARQLRLTRVTKLKVLIQKALVDFDRVAVLIDNLDKAWERNTEYESMSRFLLSLLTTVNKIEREFGKPTHESKAINLTLTVFLRTDIYEIVTKYAREPDKIDVMSVHWHDDELLVRVLEERYASNRVPKKHGTAPDMWQEVFCAEVKGLPTRDYFLWTVLPRPRDFIFFANAALTTAINRKHEIISASDIHSAEEQYSKFATDALLVEGQAENFNLDDVLYDFVGVKSIITSTELSELLNKYPNFEELKFWLVKTSFLGIEERAGNFVHVEGEITARHKLKAAEMVAARSANELRFRIHPAFRAYLQILEIDIHDTHIRDSSFELE